MHNGYYYIKNDGKVKYYKEKVPKSYLKNKKELKRRIEEISVDENLNSKIISFILSKELNGFMKYSQEDFKINQGKEISSSCMIHDAEGYGIKIIQKSKQNSYHYYAPKFFYEKCADETINKSVLKKYIELIDFFHSFIEIRFI
ncbi:MAG TPA: hypothetical protein VKY36_00135 [Moheibacter sp.]|nr:hypothetical protein [Moheibacter sp.]